MFNSNKFFKYIKKFLLIMLPILFQISLSSITNNNSLVSFDNQNVDFFLH